MNQTLEHVRAFITGMATSPKKFFVYLVAGCAGLVVAVGALSLAVFIFRMTFGGMPSMFGARDVGYAPRVDEYTGGGTWGGASGMGSDYAVSTEASVAYDSYGGGMPAKMALPRMGGGYASVPTLPPMPTVNGSRNAEKFERTGYNAQYETGRLSEVCGAIEALKPLEYVLFDSAYLGERNCNYVFRVESDKADEVVMTLKGLDPREWSVSVDTVAQQIENTGDYMATLERRLASTEATMREAEAAYARLTTLATQSGKVGDLTEIITQKLSMVERLTNEKLSLEEQIRQATNSKTDQVDETAYAHFNVSVLKRDLVNWQNIRDMWREALENTVRDVSVLISNIVLWLPVLLVQIVFWALFGGISLLAFVVFVKYMWQWAVWVWKM